MRSADCEMEMSESKIEGLIKSVKRLFSVIPAQAGIQAFKVVRVPLDSRFHGNDNFLRFQNLK